MRTLIAARANVNLAYSRTDEGKWTPLHIACFKEHEPISKLLIESNADVNALDVWNVSEHCSVDVFINRVI